MMYEYGYCRKKLAERLKNYELGAKMGAELMKSGDIHDYAIANQCYEKYKTKIIAVKCLANQIGFISYEECYDMTTRDLICKIEAELD